MFGKIIYANMTKIVLQGCATCSIIVDLIKLFKINKNNLSSTEEELPYSWLVTSIYQQLKHTHKHKQLGDATCLQVSGQRLAMSNKHINQYCFLGAD